MKSRESGLPFDDFRALLNNLPPVEEDALNLVRSQCAERLGDRESKFGELCTWYAGWSGRSPVITRPILTLFAGTHLVDTSFDAWLLDQISEISSGTSAINRICHQHDLGLKVLDLALQIPVNDITREAALDEKACAGTIAFGMEAIAGSVDLLCSAAIETAPTLSSLAILCVLSGVDQKALIGGVSAEQATAITAAVAMVQSCQDNPLEVLRRLGGRETAAICGAILAARSQHIPVIVAGPTALASMAILHAVEPQSVSHCLMAQRTGSEALDLIVRDMGVQFAMDDFVTAVPAVQLALAAGLVKSASLALVSANQA
ncbi:MAG: nicotinate-nucleotide--dimethylbenzimidazole phosphoribosyltransferase [Pseudomonadota bacterium]